jgi:hypothetical protein
MQDRITVRVHPKPVPAGPEHHDKRWRRFLNYELAEPDKICHPHDH